MLQLRPQVWLALGGLLAGLSVMAGAFGAHGLERWVETGRITLRQWENFDTAARYLMYHSLGLLAVGLLARGGGGPLLAVAGWAFLTGIVLFSGMLAGHSLTGVRTLAMIVPLGGVSFIVGWLVLAVAAWKLT